MKKIDFVIFGVIYIMVVGVVSSVFNPDMYTFGENDYVQPSANEPPRDEGIIGAIVNFLNGAFAVIASFATFMWAGLTMNIPEVPWVVRIFMCSPMWAAWMYVIVSTLWKGGE